MKSDYDISIDTVDFLLRQEAGFDDDSIIATLLEYISNQQSPEAFADFISAVLDEHKAMSEQ